MTEYNVRLVRFSIIGLIIIMYLTIACFMISHRRLQKENKQYKHEIQYYKEQLLYQQDINSAYTSLTEIQREQIDFYLFLLIRNSLRDVRSLKNSYANTLFESE